MEKAYFPPLYGDVKCEECDKVNCMNRGRYQRKRRDFTFTSGRCPRLPDHRGFVEQSERDLYAATYPLVHAERGGDDSLYLTLTIPGTKRKRTIYHTRRYWYIRDTHTAYGGVMKRVITLEEVDTKQEILEYMERFNTDYCVFRCTIEDYFA